MKTAEYQFGLCKSAILAGVIMLTASAVHAVEVVVSDDGRQIQLNSDGSWVQLSRDRYATNAAGQRVRLKPDGTWTLMDEGVSAEGRRASATVPLTPLAAAGESTLHLTRVEILKRRIKRAKSVHAETGTVYHLQVSNDSRNSIHLSADLAQSLRASSSSGGNFPITSVNYEKAEIAPGERVNITIATEGAPRWFGVKRMLLEVAAGALGNRDRRILSKDMDEVERRSVERL